MAVHWKMTDEFSCNSEIPDQLKSKLLAIDCPILGSKDDWWLKEVLFSSSEFHLNFMQWLLTNFSKSLESYFNSKQSNLDSQKQVQTQRLLTVCSDLGLCHKRDEDVIKGTAPFNKQLQFWTKLIDAFLLKIQQSGKTNVLLNERTNYNESVFFRNANRPGLDSSTYNIDCKYLSLMCEMASKHDLFQTNKSLLPPDLLKQTNSGYEVPSLNALSEMLSNVNNNVENEQLKMNEIQSERPYDLNEIVDDFGCCIVGEKITGVLSDLEKMANQFSLCHEELKPWLNMTGQPKLSNLGLKFQDACRKLEEFTNALNELAMLNESFTSLCETEYTLKNDDELNKYDNYIETTGKNIRKLTKSNYA